MNNIECNLVAENLSAFIDKELDTETSNLIKKHLSECLVCRKAFSKLLKTQYLIKNYFEKSCLSGFNTNFEMSNATKITL